jgi:hypothetical protein
MKKEKLLITFCIALFFSLSQFDASAQLMRKGELLINAGLGFGYVNASADNYYYNRTGLPVGITGNVEYAIFDEISIGGYLAFTHGNYDYYYVNGNRRAKAGYNAFDIGARGSFHFGKLMRLREKKFDPYAGALLGISNRSGDVGDYDHTWVRPGIFAGARWYFSPGFGAYAEVGYAVHPFTLGLTFRL